MTMAISSKYKIKGKCFYFKRTTNQVLAEPWAKDREERYIYF